MCIRDSINTKWLNFLGLSMPTTVDEFEQVLMAFRDNAASIKACLLYTSRSSAILSVT